jgi:CheY-like chemotaxis protein
MRASSAFESRHAERVRSRGRVEFHDADLVGRIADVAVDSVRIRTRRPPPTGTRAISVRFDHRPETSFELIGHVIRWSRTAVVLELDTVPKGFTDLVTRELEAARSEESMPRVILVETPSVTRTAIADAFRSHGCKVIEVSSPLEAVYRLAEARFEPAIIAVADTFPRAVANDLREFLAEAHPDAHMIAIGASAIGRDPAGSWLSDRTSSTLAMRVGRLLTAHASRARARPSPGSRHPWKLRDR